MDDDDTDLSLDSWIHDGEYERPPPTEYHVLNYQQIADVMGVSRVRIRQIEARALNKLRKLCAIHNVKFEDLTINDRSTNRVIKYAWRQ